MATLRRSIVVSILFTVFGGPGFVLVYIPFWITRFHLPTGEPIWRMLIAVALIWSGVHLLVYLYEEPSLARRHPEDYPRYKRNVPRWLPRLTPWQDSNAESGQ